MSWTFEDELNVLIRYQKTCSDEPQTYQDESKISSTLQHLILIIFQESPNPKVACFALIAIGNMTPTQCHTHRSGEAVVGENITALRRRRREGQSKQQF